MISGFSIKGNGFERVFMNTGAELKFAAKDILKVGIGLAPGFGQRAKGAQVASENTNE